MANDDGKTAQLSMMEAIPRFSGDDLTYSSSRWTQDLEDNAEVFGWTPQQRLIIARRSLTGTAELWLRTEKTFKTYDELKTALLREFPEAVNSKQMHEIMSARKKKTGESCYQYMLIMKELGKRAKLPDYVAIQYIIDGITDFESNKMMLYGITSYPVLKEKLALYETFKQNTKRNPTVKPASKQPRVEPENKKIYRCYNCGDKGHLASSCPNGLKCFRCNSFGHVGSECKTAKANERPSTSSTSRHHSNSCAGVGTKLPRTALFARYHTEGAEDASEDSCNPLVSGRSNQTSMSNVTDVISQNQNNQSVLSVNKNNAFNKSVKYVKIGAISVECLIDTGSDINLITYDLFSKLQIRDFEAEEMTLTGLGSCKVYSIVGILCAEDEQHDAREGDDVTMQCRFALEPSNEESLTYYWVRSTASGHDNVAIGNIPLETNYQIMYKPQEGRFDLMVANVSYERDNGRFECRIKAGGTGRNLHAQGHALTVLTQPRAPVLMPGAHALAHEGRELNLSCSSSGGSPEPIIKWFRDGSNYPLDVKMSHAKTRTEPTIATLTVMPTREDDGASYRCTVWNRAMPEGGQMDATVELNVSYFPRVEVGPENPLRVEIDGTATMDCKVDAKPKVNSVRWTRNGKFISNSFSHTIQGVTVQDAGKYTCSADNGLGRPGERDMYLDVLFPPTVTVESKTYEAEEGGTVEIKCEVSANPDPISIEWTMEGKPDFHQKGNTLTLSRVNAEMVGTYLCRAVNVISSSNGKRVERSSSASVAVLVRHKPGRAYIRPDRPVAQEGTGVTLTCSAKPPGWPAPQFRWFRDIDPTDSKPAVLATGSTYTIPSAHLGSEGVYHCQATNELGHGDLASVTLEVHQPPRFQTKLQPHVTQRSGEVDFFATCSALGKPMPSVKWYKNNSEIKPDTNLYEVQNEVTEGRNAVYNVQSTLKFNGKARPSTNDLLPEDRGIYSCIIENEVKKIESTMHLRIEHEPISIRQHKKVAYDVMEIADIVCRVQAYPKPEFQWFYGSNTAPLQMSSDGHYEINTTTDNNDSYLSVLRIKNVKPQDYGDYYCKVKNSLGSIRPQIRLQPKGAPESPRSLESQKVGASFVTLKWEAGFDGGLSNTKYFVRYRRVSGRGAVGEHCAAARAQENDWMEYDCGRANPCNVTRLDQHTTYTFKVKAVNTKGQSNFSNEISVTTKVDRIAPPERVTYDPKTRGVAFTAPPTCLSLVAVAEGLASVAGTTGWQVVETMPLKMSGEPTVVESVLDVPAKSMRSRQLQQSRVTLEPLDELNPRVRLKLCLQLNQEVCSEYTEAEIGAPYVREANIVSMTYIFLVGALIVVLTLCVALFAVYFRTKRNKKANEARSKDYEMDPMKPSIVTPQNQEKPPPYSASTGMENKALEHSMDMSLGIDDSKNGMYATQGGYAYHRQAPRQNASHDWNMGFIDNSYANSHNGGSVNSQESLWAMKMAVGGVEGMGQLERASNYEYDAHGGYGHGDEFAQYSRLPHVPHAPHAPHVPHAPHAPPADYSRSQNPSRQEYCSDPYASVHKPKKPRRDQHMESQYHEVAGLPEYGGEEAEEKPPAHLSLSYDESLESGYSTPNTRSQRVIREIIV